MAWWMALIGGGMSLMGGQKEAERAEQIGEDEATIHEFNATMNDLESAAILRNSVDIMLIMSKERDTGLSKIKAKMGKTGISLSSVSAFEVQLEAARIYAENMDRFRTDAGNRALKHRRLAALDRRKADAARRGGHFTADAAWSRSVGEAFQYGGQAYSQYQQSRDPMVGSFSA